MTRMTKAYPGMRKWLCSWVFLSLLLDPSPRAFSQTPPVSKGENRPAPSAEPKISVEPPSTAFPIKEEVKILRAERRKKMPYLDKGYVKETIDPKKIQAKQVFTEGGEKTLKEIVARAENVYTPAQAAKERISLAKRRILVATRELLPGVSFNFELRNGSLSADAFTGNDFHFTVRIPIFRGGILWNTLLREKAEYRAAKKEYDGILNEVVDEVSKAYFEFNRARETYQDKQTLVQRGDQQQGISKKKFEAALISEIESLNVESMTGQFRYDLETAEQELELAKLELQRFLALDIEDPLQIASLYDAGALIKEAETALGEEKPGERRALKQSLDEFIDLAYQNRPELQVEAERLRAARLEEKIKKGVFLPRADLLMEAGEMGESFIRNADDPRHSHEWRLGFELSDNLFGNKMKYTFDNDENAPSVSQFLQDSGSQVTRRKLEVGLFDGLEDYTESKEATVKKLEQVIELEKKEREVIREVKEAYFDFHKAEIQVEASLKRNQYRQKLVDYAKLRLEKAEIEISDYLQAESDLAEERARLHRSLADLFKAKSKLNRSIGLRDFLPIEERYAL